MDYIIIGAIKFHCIYITPDSTLVELYEASVRVEAVTETRKQYEQYSAKNKMEILHTNQKMVLIILHCLTY